MRPESSEVSCIRVKTPDPDPAFESVGLQVGGLTALTTIDYPGELAAVIFCQGCPWRCRYCHNGDLLPRSAGAFSWNEIVDFLKRRRGLLDAVVFSGGEPTLQRGLGEAMAAVRDLGFKVGLHTAGCYPERLARVLPLVDWVGLDIKALPEDYDMTTGVPGSGEGAWESLAIVLSQQCNHEVRVTVHDGLQEEEHLEALVVRLLGLGVQSLALQQCQWHGMLDRALGPAGTSWMDRIVRSLPDAAQGRVILRA